MKDTPILVLGGTGKTGRRVAGKLAAAGRTARIASRSGAQRFDWHDRETWPAALEGIEAVYVVDEQGAEAAELLAEFTELATRLGTRRLVFLSARTLEQFTHDESMFAAERAVQDSGTEWTILRPTWFTQNFTEEPLLSRGVADGALVRPRDLGREPCVDVDDIADVAVAALTEDGHAGEIYGLSGPRLMTFGECVEQIAEASGRDVRLVEVESEEYVRHLTGRGFPLDFAEFVNQIFDTIREGQTAYLSDGVERALNRPPRDFSAYIAETDWKAVFDR